MKVLFIDPGNFSLKAFYGELDKKNVQIRQCFDFLMADHRSNHGQELSIDEIRIRIMKGLVKQLSFEGKIISLLPSHLSTTRILTLPVDSKKKAEALIPFQLEDDLPYPGGQIHFTAKATPIDRKFHALVSVVEKNRWENYFQLYQSQAVLADLIIPSIGPIQDFCESQNWQGDVAILDIGHEATQAYFIRDGLISSCHFVGVAGHKITEAISHHYQISYPEAQKYKHENGFVLLPEQMTNAAKEQKEFAQLMDKVFQTLGQQFRRWDVGHKILTGSSVRQIYLTGGTSALNNLAPYLSQLFQVPVQMLNPYTSATTKTQARSLPKVMEDRGRFHLLQLLAFDQTLKARALNLRTGDYSSRAHDDLPLHSLGHISWRVAALTVLIFFGLFSERLFLALDDKELNARLSEVLKKPDLELSAPIRRNAAKDPEAVLNKIISTEKSVVQEINLIQSSHSRHGLDELQKLSDFLKSKPQIALTAFKQDQTQLVFSMSAEDMRELEAIKSEVENSLFGKANNIELRPGDKILRATFAR